MNNSNITTIIESLKESVKNIEETTLNKNSKKFNEFQMLIACIISLQAKDESTKEAVKNLFKLGKSPKEILKVPDKKIEKILYKTRFRKKKTKTIKNISKIILKRYNNKVPDNIDELMSIKGVGKKTANIVLCLSFNKPFIPVDSNMHRVINRIGLFKKTKNPEQTEKLLIKNVPKTYWKELNSIFMRFGKNYCTPISPYCSKCPIKKKCKKVNVIKSR